MATKPASSIIVPMDTCVISGPTRKASATSGYATSTKAAPRTARRMNRDRWNSDESTTTPGSVSGRAG